MTPSDKVLNSSNNELISFSLNQSMENKIARSKYLTFNPKYSVIENILRIAPQGVG